MSGRIGDTRGYAELGVGAAGVTSPEAVDPVAVGAAGSGAVGAEISLTRDDKFILGVELSADVASPASRADGVAQNSDVGVSVDATGNPHPIAGANASGNPFNGAGETHNLYTNVGGFITPTAGFRSFNGVLTVKAGPRLGLVGFTGATSERQDLPGNHDLKGVSFAWGGEIGASVALPEDIANGARFGIEASATRFTGSNTYTPVNRQVTSLEDSFTQGTVLGTIIFPFGNGGNIGDLLRKKPRTESAHTSSIGETNAANAALAKALSENPIDLTALGIASITYTANNAFIIQYKDSSKQAVSVGNPSDTVENNVAAVITFLEAKCSTDCDAE